MVLASYDAQINGLQMILSHFMLVFHSKSAYRIKVKKTYLIEGMCFIIITFYYFYWISDI
jgi:hypothetical protein